MTKNIPEEIVSKIKEKIPNEIYSYIDTPLYEDTGIWLIDLSNKENLCTIQYQAGMPFLLLNSRDEADFFEKFTDIEQLINRTIEILSMES